ncbi:MAG: hypothetical protein ACYDDZ_10955 [Acidimicrobiales bacterium]
MSVASGAIAGGLGVIVLRAAVMNPHNVATGSGALVGVAQRFLDPSVPAIPNVASKKTKKVKTSAVVKPKKHVVVPGNPPTILT